MIRIYKGLLDEDDSRAESGFSFYLEEAGAGDARHLLREERQFRRRRLSPDPAPLQTFSDEPIRKAIKEHEKLAENVFELDEHVAGVVAKLKAKGLTSPYLQTFVVARINPLRWIKGDPPPLDEVLKTMRERAASSTPRRSSRKISPPRAAQG